MTNSLPGFSLDPTADSTVIGPKPAAARRAAAINNTIKTAEKRRSGDVTQIVNMAGRVVVEYNNDTGATWSRGHHNTCPYECDCPMWARRMDNG